jgi:membrane protein
MAKNRFRIKDMGSLVKATYKEWNEDDPFRQSAVIAYYAIFSIPALLVIVISLAGFAFGKEAVSGEITSQIGSAIGEDAAKDVEAMIAKAGEKKNSIWATALGIGTLIFGATSVFAQLQKTLNIIWEVEPKPKKPWLAMLRTRLFSFGLIVSIGFLLLISLVLTSMLSVLSDWIQSMFPDFIMYLFYVLNFLISLGTITVLFALMFKILPDAKIRWRSVWVGAIVTAILFVIGKFALGIYFGKSDPGSTYGAAGSLILLLLWVSYSCMIVFFGAEFTKQFALKYGYGIQPTEVAQMRDESHDKKTGAV